jgi:hypothetical protein
MVSLRSIHLVKGRVVIAAETQLALMHRAGIRSRWTKTSGTEAALELKRPNDEAVEFVYTLEDAKAAGLTGRDTWRKHPGAMLRARCISTAARAFAPEVVSGCYTPDEAVDMAPTYEDPPQASRRPQRATNRPNVEDGDGFGAPDFAIEDHDPTFEEDRPGFMATLADLGWNYEGRRGGRESLVDFLEWLGKPRPSSMSREQRSRLVAWLQTEAANERAGFWVDEMGFDAPLAG